MSRPSPRDVYEAHIGTMLERVATRAGRAAELADFRTADVALMELEQAGWNDLDDEDIPHDLRRLRGISRSALIGEVCRMQEERDDARRDAFMTIMRYLFSGGPHPLAVAERAFLLARWAGSHLLFGMKQWEVGALFGDIRQTWREKERRMIEELASRFSTVEFTNAGGKSWQARAKQALARLGNTSKKHGRRKGEARPETEARVNGSHVPGYSERDMLNELRREEERERLAELAGVDPDEIDLSLVTPERD